MDFPQYRKRFDNKSFYKIINEQSMEEVQIIGEKKFFHQLKADKYFEKVLISEVLEAASDLYEKISWEEWQNIAKK